MMGLLAMMILRVFYLCHFENTCFIWWAWCWAL